MWWRGGSIFFEIRLGWVRLGSCLRRHRSEDHPRHAPLFMAIWVLVKIWKSGLTALWNISRKVSNKWGSLHWKNWRIKTLNLQRLDERRLKLCLQFAKKLVSATFPLNDNEANLRNPEKYEVKFARTGRLFNSAAPSLQRLLNDNP